MEENQNLEPDFLFEITDVLNSKKKLVDFSTQAMNLKQSALNFFPFNLHEPD